MLDPLPEAARLPRVARAVEGVERGLVCGVADRVHTDRPARFRGLAHDPLELFARRDHDSGSVAHPRGLRAERPVHERLQVAEAQERGAGAAAEADLAEVGELLGRSRLPDAKRQRALLLEPLPEADRAEPAVLVVEGRDAPRGGDLDAFAHRLDVLLVGHAREPALEAPRRFLVEDAGRLACLVPDHDTAFDLEVAAGERERCRVEPQRVVVLRDQHRGPLALDLIERLAGWRAVGPVGVAPPLATEPATGPRRGPQAVERLGERRAVVERHVVPCKGPRREVDVRVGEAGQHAAAAEVDRLGARQRRLVHPDAARDPVACDPERGHGRQRRVERANRPVAEDHAQRAYAFEVVVVDSRMAIERPVERRIVSVLFADLVGFTSLSEQLDAEDVTLVQDAYFDAVRETVARHGGQLEKFVGDAAMAVFGAPRVRDDDAERAVRAGLALVAAVQRVGAGLGLAPGALRLRVGVASGETVYGEASAERGPVTGDVVNVAARLQAAGEPETVTIGEATALAVADAVELERLAPLDLKGKSEPVPAWRVVGVYAERSRERALGGLQAPTLGRADEVTRLRALVGATARVVVVAPPGVGKTRLLDELAAAASGAAVLRARLRPDVLSPFEPVAQLAGGTREPTELAALARAAGASQARAAVVAELLGAVGSAAIHPAAEREQLFSAWLEGLDAVAGERAAVWLVEDIHWASPDLLAFLELAGGSTRSAGRLVVASARPVLLDERPEWVESGERVDLPLLPPSETEQLVRELVGDALPLALVERIAERSAGNPLFVEELLRTWAGVGILVAEQDGWRLATAADEVELPLTVQAIYAAQLDDLPPPARAAARRAAVAGRRFPRAALAVLEIEEPDAALETLTRRALVSVADEDPLLGPSHSYRHALLRDAGYASLARAERARLHVQLADWLAARPERTRPALAEVIGRHFAAALEAAPALARAIGGLERDEIRARAAEWFETAARVAIGFAAWASARELAARALELTAEVPLDRARRLHLLGEATADAAGVDEALPLLEESLEAYRSFGADAPRTGIVDAAFTLARLLGAQTRFSAGEELAGNLLHELGEQDDAPTARLLALRGSGALSASDDFPRARADGERALALARAVGDEDAELEALQLLTSCLDEGDELEDQRWAELESLARARGRWDVAAGAMRARSFISVADEPERTLADLEAAAELAEARGLVAEAVWVDFEHAEAHLVAGSWDDALAFGLRAIEAAEERNLSRLAVRSWFALRPIAQARRRTDLIERAFPLFERIRGSSQSPYARVVVGAMELAFAEAGLQPTFVPELEPRLASFDLGYGDPSWLAAVEAVVGAWLDAGALAEARTALDRLRAASEGKNLSKLALASQALLRSRLALAEGDAAEAAVEAERALQTQAPWWRALALRALEAAGAATPEALAEAAALEQTLGVEPRTPI